MVTALTIMVNFVAFVMTPKEAGLTLLIYLLLGIVGVPVFVGGTSGIAKIIGPTGGFNIFGGGYGDECCTRQEP